MSKNISLNEIKEFWPEKAPDINIVQKYVKKYQNETQEQPGHQDRTKINKEPNTIRRHV